MADPDSVKPGARGGRKAGDLARSIPPIAAEAASPQGCSFVSGVREMEHPTDILLPSTLSGLCIRPPSGGESLAESFVGAGGPLELRRLDEVAAPSLPNGSVRITSFDRRSSEERVRALQLHKLSAEDHFVMPMYC